jgi:hypothetical protein
VAPYAPDRRVHRLGVFHLFCLRQFLRKQQSRSSRFDRR